MRQSPGPVPGDHASRRLQLRRGNRLAQPEGPWTDAALMSHAPEKRSGA